MKKLHFLIAVFFILGLSGCDLPSGPYKIIPADHYDVNIQNAIMGKWKLVGKSIGDRNHCYVDIICSGCYRCNYTDNVEEGKYIEFSKIENEKYGVFLSNMQPEEAYYIPTFFSIYLYYSLDSLKKSSTLFNDVLEICNEYPREGSDTLQLLSASIGSSGWLGDGSEYRYYYFIKMENE